MKKTYSIMFDQEFIILKATDSPTIISTRLSHIFSKIKKLHHDHMKSFDPGNKFETDTKAFLQYIIKCHLNAHIDSYIQRYYKKDTNTFTGWKNLLYGVIEEIEYQMDLDEEQTIPFRHKIRIINRSVNVKEHSISILIINTETESILRVNIILERDVKVFRSFISVKVGSILFEPEE